MCVGMWLVLRDTPPNEIERWREGAEGERKTAKALATLERCGWHIEHDVQCRYGNYDHIAVGPAGIYLIETKNLSGAVELQDGVPHLRRRFYQRVDALDTVKPRALSAAAHLKQDLERHLDRRVGWVQAIVAIWSDFPEGIVENGRCVFVHGPRLHAHLYGQPHRLDRDEVDRIAVAFAKIARHVRPEESGTLSAPSASH